MNAVVFWHMTLMLFCIVGMWNDLELKIGLMQANLLALGLIKQ